MTSPVMTPRGVYELPFLCGGERVAVAVDSRGNRVATCVIPSEDLRPEVTSRLLCLLDLLRPTA